MFFYAGSDIHYRLIKLRKVFASLNYNVLKSMTHNNFDEIHEKISLSYKIHMLIFYITVFRERRLICSGVERDSEKLKTVLSQGSNEKTFLVAVFADTTGVAQHIHNGLLQLQTVS